MYPCIHVIGSRAFPSCASYLRSVHTGSLRWRFCTKRRRRKQTSCWNNRDWWVHQIFLHFHWNWIKPIGERERSPTLPKAMTWIWAVLVRVGLIEAQDFCLTVLTLLWVASSNRFLGQTELCDIFLYCVMVLDEFFCFHWARFKLTAPGLFSWGIAVLALLKSGRY